MRTCIFKVHGDDGAGKLVDKAGYFHGWGYEAPACEGDGNYSIGVCEDVDGNIFTPYPAHIKFTDRRELEDPIMLGLCVLVSLDSGIKVSVDSEGIFVKWGNASFVEMPEECLKDLIRCSWQYIKEIEGWRHFIK